jgi:class 3 adenylate cyclase/tetratricopeptide (TPR) repeat protein
MERKLATVLFVDLVDSTSLLAGADPEIVRLRVTRYFDSASERIKLHGGTVEKFAGDAVMAAFGVPQAHEDDAERAVRAAFDVLEAVHELGLEARVGIEAGELVVDEGDSTFATGEAVNVAARLQQSAGPDAIALGPVARRLTLGAVDVEDAGAVEIRPGEQTWSWRVLRVLDMRRRRPKARFVGREHELELLRNSHDRTVRDRRATLITVYGDAGVGKSRLVEEFTSAVERATVLTGRALPYGEGVAFWPIASMVKASAGITDDDPAAEAFEKLRVSCESEAVADLLGVALGVLGAADDGAGPTETSWAALRWAEQLGDAQPLVLVFEDVQWADERMLDVIEHLARSLRDVPVLIICVARFELLEERATWGGGNPRASAIELTRLPEAESAELADALLPAGETPPTLRALVLERAEGNPLFLEETARMLLEADGSAADDRIPDSVQTLISARIDLLPIPEKRLLQHAAVIGRIFWRGALDHLAPELVGDAALAALCERDFISTIERSAIPGDHAYQFSHGLIREVAYAGMTKAERAEKHRQFADWLEQREGEDLVEIRAHHLDQTATLLAELYGSVPAELAARTAAALEQAGDLALRRDSFGAARRLYGRAVELEPTLHRRYEAAAAARGLNQLTTVAAEMERVRDEAHQAGDRALEGQALTALADVVMYRDGEPAEAARLATLGLELLPEEEIESRSEALRQLAAAAWWQGDLPTAEARTRTAIALAERAERNDLWVRGMGALQWLLEVQLDFEGAEASLVACQARGEEGVVARARARFALGSLRRMQGRLDEARLALEEARQLYLDAGAAGDAAWAGLILGWVDVVEGSPVSAARAFREAVRVFGANEDHGHLCEAQRALAELHLAEGKVEDAERHALTANALVSPHDLTSRSSTMATLARVRAAQGRSEEAEQLLNDGLALLDGTGFRLLEIVPLVALVEFLYSRERGAEAAELEARVPDPIPAWLGAEDARTPAALSS